MSAIAAARLNRVGGGVKVYLYHFPQQSAVPFTLDLLGRLIKAFPGTIKGVKDSSGDYANMLADEVMVGDALPFDQLMDACAEVAAKANAAATT